MKTHHANRLKRYLAIYFVLLACVASSAVGVERVTLKNVGFAQKYVMASCIIKRYQDQPLSSEAQGWAGGVLENSGFSIEQYQRLAKIGENKDPVEISKNGQVVNIQACFSLATSAATRNKILKILRR